MIAVVTISLFVVVAVTICIIPVVVAPVVFPVPLIAVFVIVAPAVVTVARDVLVLVPVIAYEVDPAAARVVLATVAVPVPLVAGRYVQVDWRRIGVFRRPFNKNGSRINHCSGGHIADIDLPEETRFANIDRNPDICGHAERRRQG